MCADRLTAMKTPAQVPIFWFRWLLVVMVGWGVTLLLILWRPFRRGSGEVWLILSVSVAVWSVPDTLFSLWAGFWQNALLNLVFALLFAVPLAATHGLFKNDRTPGIRE